jgi:hypothetical protein
MSDFNPDFEPLDNLDELMPDLPEREPTKRKSLASISDYLGRIARALESLADTRAH